MNMATRIQKSAFGSYFRLPKLFSQNEIYPVTMSSSDVTASMVEMACHNLSCLNEMREVPCSIR
jgi:hypothetical protein